MIKPYIFGHRGAMVQEIENTLPSFKKALDLGADGIETDVRLTKDKELICFHDPAFKIKSKWHSIKNLTLEQISELDFEDEREICTICEVFGEFSMLKESIRFSCDIGNKAAGAALIKIAEQYNVLERVEITDTRLKLLSDLRDLHETAKLVYTIPYEISKINEQTVNFEKLKELNISTINLKFERAKEENFRTLIDNGFRCYCWGVNFKSRMKRVLRLCYKNENVEAIYTNYPKVFKKIRDDFFS